VLAEAGLLGGAAGLEASGPRGTLTKADALRAVAARGEGCGSGPAAARWAPPSCPPRPPSPLCPQISAPLRHFTPPHPSFRPAVARLPQFQETWAGVLLSVFLTTSWGVSGN